MAGGCGGGGAGGGGGCGVGGYQPAEASAMAGEMKISA